MKGVLLLPASILVASCASGDATAETAPVVRVVAVGMDGGVQRAELTGTVTARVEANLAFRESGQIVARNVDDGARVSAGTILARLDPVDLADGASAARAQAAAAAGSVAAAEATAQRAAADLARLDGLVEAGAISKSVYDAAVEGDRAARAQLASARAQAAAASANARVAGNRQRYADLRADADGVITAVLAEPGQVVAAGTPVFRLARSGPREVEIAIPEQQHSAVPRAATGELYGGGTFRLELRELAAAADPATRTYRARYRILDAAPPLGATVTVRMSVPQSGSASAVPLGALAERGGGNGVWVIGKDGKVAWRAVRLLGMDGENAHVTGLSRGERVVALGAHLLQPGQAVRVAGKQVAANVR